MGEQEIQGLDMLSSSVLKTFFFFFFLGVLRLVLDFMYFTETDLVDDSTRTRPMVYISCD